MTAESDAVLTSDELAEYMRIAASTVYKLARLDRIPARKVGSHWRFRKAAIDRWLDRSRGPDAGTGDKEDG